jgi:adenylate kinase family enzyme
LLVVGRSSASSSAELSTLRRIAVVGSGGAGKSTLSRQLASALGLPLVHLDREYWLPGWTERPDYEWRPIVERLAGDEEWIIDGNFGGTLDVRVAAADLVVVLDLPRWLCLYRAVKRALFDRHHGDLPEGCPERLDPPFLRWVWRYPIDTRPLVERAVADHPNVVWLSSPREVREFVGSVRA